MSKLLLFLLATCLLSSCATKPLKTVETVNLTKYSGKWYEIARYPNFFQRNCAGKVTAEYLPAKDGSITVVNSCRKKDGTIDRVEGRATTNSPDNSAKLKVTFGGPFAGDYWIIGLDPSYRWALVGHPSRRYLWILSRTPSLPDDVYAGIVRLAVEQGYKADRIVKTPQ